MADLINRDNLFAPASNKAEAKNDATTRFAKQITDAEVRARQAKTERLRAARLAITPVSEAEPATKSRNGRKAKARA